MMETERDTKNKHEATAPTLKKRMVIVPDLKVMSTQALSKIVEKLEQMTDGRMKLSNLFCYRACPTTKTTNKKGKVERGKQYTTTGRTSKKMKTQTAAS